jgi:hypothetical protein
MIGFTRAALAFRAMIAAMLLSTALCGCVDAKPKTAEIVGGWSITTASRHLLPASSANIPAKLEFSGDGTFVATNVPNTLFSADSMPGPPVTGRGKWKLGESEGHQQVQLEFLSTNQPDKYGSDYGTQLNVARESADIVLFYYRGDPDEQDRVEFAKQ